MQASPSYQHKRIGVLGLARTGLAAAKALSAAGADVWCWDDNEDRRRAAPGRVVALQTADLSPLSAVLLSPGVPLAYPKPHPIVIRAREAGVPLISDFDVFEQSRPQLAKHALIGITGTNGKSTTTALTTHILQHSEIPALMAGNIGQAVMAAQPLPAGGVYVVELSSFQLELTGQLTVDIAVQLNLSPDHLDRHGTMAAYAKAKRRLFDMQKPGATAVIGIDDDHGRALAQTCAQPVIQVSGRQAVDGGVYVDGGILCDARAGEPSVVADMRDCPALQGDHNAENAAASCAALLAIGMKPEEIAAGLKSFPGLAHRQERVTGGPDGITVINDSKATNVEAALRALATFRRIRLIAGGYATTEDLRPLAALSERIASVYANGESGHAVAQAFGGIVPVATFPAFADAVKAALADADSGDCVLLSPAAKAFDQFANFEERGDAFKALVRQAGAGGDAC